MCVNRAKLLSPSIHHINKVIDTLVAQIVGDKIYALEGYITVLRLDNTLERDGVLSVAGSVAQCVDNRCSFDEWFPVGEP